MASVCYTWDGDQIHVGTRWYTLVQLVRLVRWYAGTVGYTVSWRSLLILQMEEMTFTTGNRRIRITPVYLAAPIAPSPALAFSRMSGFSGLMRMQAAECCGLISASAGALTEHSSIAHGQRVWKRHPDGGLIGEGTSP